MTAKINKSKRPILLVEVNPEDYETTLRAFKKADIRNPVIHCEDGDEALDFLYHRGQFGRTGKAPRPVVIILDLNLPGTNGRDVLVEIKSMPKFKSIPVIVLTTSSDERDIDQCYSNGANSYIQKPVDLNSFVEAIKQMKQYWFDVVILPKEGDLKTRWI